MLKTSAGTSTIVSAGETILTALGFAGIYALLALLFAFLVAHIIAQGPEDAERA